MAPEVNPAPIRVLHAVEDLKIGGMERVIASIVTGLDPAKYDTQVLCLTRGGAVADELTGRGISVTTLGLGNYHHPSQLFALYRWLRGQKIQILHTHGYFAGVFARLAGLHAGIPHMISHVHSTYVDFQIKHLFMERLLSYRTDRIVCVSRAVQDWVFEGEGIRKGKTIVIYNGTAPFFVAPSTGSIPAFGRRALGIPEHDTVFTVVASLTPNKGHRVLLESFAALLEEHPNATLLIVGDGPLRHELEGRAWQQKIDRKIVFTGQQTDISDLLRISDVGLLPSQSREGLGMALIEAMAAGLPVIGTNLGGIPEVIADGENGILVPLARADLLADAMKRLATDREARLRMGRRSRQIYEANFTLDGMICHIEALYASLQNQASA